MSEWQPIETAPKDGSFIILYEKYSDPFIGRWFKSEWYPQTDFVCVGGWDGYLESNVVQNNITHWMPLPKPPTGKS